MLPAKRRFIEPRDRLVRGFGRRVRRRDRAHALGDQAGDSLSDAQRGAERTWLEAVVAAHHERFILRDIDAGDRDARDEGDLIAHRVQHRLDRPVVARELDQPQDAVDARADLSLVVYLDDAFGHDVPCHSPRLPPD